MDELELDRLLSGLGIERGAGRKYIHEAMIMDPHGKAKLQDIYLALGEKHGAKPNTVRSAIGRAIKQAYKNPATALMIRYFSPSLLPAKTPTNKQFLHRLVLILEAKEQKGGKSNA